MAKSKCWFEYCTYNPVFYAIVCRPWIEQIEVCLLHSQLNTVSDLVPIV